MEYKRLLILVFLTLSTTTLVAGAEYTDNSLDQDGDGRSLSEVEQDILDSMDFEEDESQGDPATKTVPVEEDPVEVSEPVVVATKAHCLGCPEMIDSQNEKIQDMALFAFGDYMAKNEGQSGSEDEAIQTLVRVIKAERQLVAGMKYILEVELGWSNCSKSQYRESAEFCSLDSAKPTFNCDFHVLEKVWDKTKEVVHGKCHKDDTPVTEDTVVAPSPNDEPVEGIEVEGEIESGDSDSSKRRRKREGKFGETKGAVDDKQKLLDIAKFAVYQLDEVDEDNLARVVVDILNANKQTVSGWLYHLKIRVAQTSCEENSGATIEKCHDKITLPFQRCEVKVLFQPWQTVQMKLVHSQCVREDYKKSKKVAKQLFRDMEKSRKRMRMSEAEEPLIGGGKVIDPESEDIADLVNFAIDSVDLTSNALHAQKLVRVVYAERKLVAGVSTKLVLELGYTKCRKTPALDKSTCSVDEDRDHTYCNVTIVEKKWLNEKKMVSSKCGKRQEVMQERRKRETSDETEDIEEVDADRIEFGHFLEKHGKQYGAAEYEHRLTIFKDNMEKVRLLQKTEQGTAVYGSTYFADLSGEEFSTRHLGLRIDLKQRMKRKQAKIPYLRSLPDSFDWRNYSAVTPVKNQGMCGSCWAFSVTGNIEGVYAIKHGKLLSFSEQELVDCDKMDEGCNGGLPENAYKALEKLGGLETEGDYPYDGHNDRCQFNSTKVAAKVTGFVEVSKNETEMAAWLVKNGPISIGINANVMQFYFGGVSHPWKFLCSPKNLDHGVLIVGYGVHVVKRKSIPYWIVKNSWGPSWGEKGYYRIYRGDGSCGVNQMATSAYAE